MTARIMLLGPVRAGKTTLLQALLQADGKAEKTQSIQFYDGGIDTPGEYSQMPRYYSALQVTAMGASHILIIQDASDTKISLPPGFARMFSKPVAGVVTKIDLPNADRQRACQRLKQAGVKQPVFYVSAHSGEGLEDLIEFLTEGRENNE